MDNTTLYLAQVVIPEIILNVLTLSPSIIFKTATAKKLFNTKKLDSLQVCIIIQEAYLYIKIKERYWKAL